MQLQEAIKRLFYWAIQSVRAVARHLLGFLTSPHVTFLIGEPTFWLLGMRGRRRKNDLSQVKRVLVVRLDEIGDVVLTTPFLRELRRNLPNAWITLVVKPAVHNLVELCPYANEVLTYDWSISGVFAPLQRHWRVLRFAYCYLWPRHFDLAIVPRWDADYYHATYVAYFSGARWRVGYSENVDEHKLRLNGSFDRLFTHVLNDRTLRHEVERNLEVIRCLGGGVQDQRMELWVGDEDEAFAESVLREAGILPGEMVIGFGPSGGGSPLKTWPLNSFIELGCSLRRKYICRILVFGGPGEEGLGWQIERAVGHAVINVVGKTTLRQMAALLERCDLYVGNDSGPMHVAAAVGTPVEAIFGGSCHHRFGPWGNGDAVLSLALPCSPCFQMHHPDRCSRCIFDRPHCLVDLTVAKVKEAIEARLSERKCSIARKRALEYADSLVRGADEKVDS